MRLDIERLWSQLSLHDVDKRLSLRLIELFSQEQAEVNSAEDLVLSLRAFEQIKELLELYRGKLYLRRGLELHSAAAVSRSLCFLAEQAGEGHPLCELLAQGCFQPIFMRSCMDVEWSSLEIKERERLVEASLSSVSVEAGSFLMGALPEDELAHEREKPRHKVTLDHSLQCLAYPVTQGLYELLIHEASSSFKGASRPAEQLSWLDGVVFCNVLSRYQGLAEVYELPEGSEKALREQRVARESWSGKVNLYAEKVTWNSEATGWRLPTEAEWEYLARAEAEELYAGGDELNDVGWSKENSGDETQAVGQKRPNSWGLYDMSGNVWEWCWDWWDEPYSGEAEVDPTGPLYSLFRVYRGGSWVLPKDFARVSSRYYDYPSRRRDQQGLRLVRSLF